MPESTPHGANPTSAEPVDQRPAETPPSADPPTTPAAATTGAAPSPSESHVVYVETPAPPRDKSNRLVGGLLALLGGGAFAAALAISVFLLSAVIPAAESGLGSGRGPYTGSAYFWVPVLFFTIGFVILSLLLNRAGWWLYVVFSIAVGLFTYFASIGVLLLLDSVILMTGAQAAAAFWELVTDLRLVVAALVGREVALWMGLAIAARGRRVRARNAERRAVFDQEVAEKKAEHERAAGAAA